MEISGKLYKILEAQSGKSAKGEWKKQEFIIETEEQFPKKVCIANWNDKIDLKSIAIGTALTLSVNVESREYNGKWYTDVRVWKMESKQNESSSEYSNTNTPPAAPLPTADDMNWDSGDEVDDLPF